MSKHIGIHLEEGFTKYLRKDGKVTISNYQRWRLSITVNGKRIRKSFNLFHEAIYAWHELLMNKTT